MRFRCSSSPTSERSSSCRRWPACTDTRIASLTSSTKWALVGFAKTLALELGSFGITANTIHPGAVAGQRMESVLRGRAEIAGTSVEQERTKALANQAVDRFVEASEIADLALFLASPAGRSITGQTFAIDGGSKAAQ